MDIIKVRVARPGDRKRLTDFQVQMALETEGQELDRRIAVSYTHLDVYKRQATHCA